MVNLMDSNYSGQDGFKIEKFTSQPVSLEFISFQVFFWRILKNFPCLFKKLTHHFTFIVKDQGLRTVWLENWKLFFKSDRGESWGPPSLVDLAIDPN